MPAHLETTKQLLASNVRVLRARFGFSQEELAFRAGIDRTYASQIERGIANPSLSIICALADALECEIETLLLDKSQAQEFQGCADR